MSAVGSVSPAYCLDLRERVVAAPCDDGLTYHAIATRFRVGERTVRGWLRRARVTGSLAARPHSGGMPAKVDAAGLPVLLARLADQSGRTLAELAAACHAATGTVLSVAQCRSVSTPSVEPVCGSMCGGKKRRYASAEQTREDVAAARAAWQAAASTLRPADLVFIDESGIATNMGRVYGRALGSRRAVAALPYGRRERLTLFGGLSLAGLVACMSVDGATDAAVLVAFTAEVLVPVLRPGQVVVLDHLRAHKTPRVRELIEAAGCTLLFLPPDSPDRNPIGAAWSKLKTLLRGLGARTTAALDAPLVTLVDAITAQDAQGFFRHCGYPAR